MRRVGLACIAILGCGGPMTAPTDGSTPPVDGGHSTPVDGGTIPEPYYDTTTWGVQFADMILETWPDARDISSGSGFQYNNGIVLHGLERIYGRTHDARYLEYIRAFVDAFIGPTGDSLDLGTMHDVDRIQPAILLPFLYEETGDPRYLTAAQHVRDRYDTFPTNSEGGFWHKQQYPNELWCDTIYMTEPFLSRFGAVSPSCGAYCNDMPAFQTTLLAEHAQSDTTGLLVHGWEADHNASWADPVTGLAPIVWSRGTGWYAMSIVDILDDLPADQARRAELLSIFSALADGLRNTQDPATGLWFQVVDQGDRTDNWDEVSGSAMIVYALKKAVDHGYIAADFLDVARRGWEGLKAVVEAASTGGMVRITGAVQGMGIQNDYASYVNKTRLTNSPHGLCGILMAASQMEAFAP